MMQQIDLFGNFYTFFLQSSRKIGLPQLFHSVKKEGRTAFLTRPCLLLCAFLAMAQLAACQNKGTRTITHTPVQDSLPLNVAVPPQRKATSPVVLGAERKEAYLPLLKGKRVGLIVNHTSLVPQKKGEPLHLVDLLLQEGIQVKKVFAPEHGFRGTADAGEKVLSGTDAKTGLPVVSLYGSNKKPTAEQLQDLDVLLFDIQDVGARFYTYISTMHYAMEAAAEQGKEFVVLDRPNPNGHIIDGPVLEPGFKSFVGMHPIPVVHGATVAELAQMINGEGWLDGERKVDLKVVPMQHYTHHTPYILPVRPSPNLPNQQAVLLYPSLCFFEGTPISLGRGTPFPFQAIGYTSPDFGSFTFTPTSMPGAKNPPLEGKQLWGLDLRQVTPPDRLDIGFIMMYYKLFAEKDKFFQKFFHTLAGTDKLAQQIKQGLTEEQIRESWEEELEEYKTMRMNYLLYPDGN